MTLFQKEFIQEIIDYLPYGDLRLLRANRPLSTNQKKDIRELIKSGIITKTPQETIKWIRPREVPIYDTYHLINRTIKKNNH